MLDRIVDRWVWKNVGFLCHLEWNRLTYTTTSRPDGWDVIEGHPNSYVALLMIKHCNMFKLIWCINGGSSVDS